MTLGKHLHEIFGWDGPMTDRQYQAWMIWLEDEWNNPDRHDFYTMQSAMESCRSRLKNPSQVKLDDFRLKFQIKQRVSESYLSPEDKVKQYALNIKMMWLGMMTMPVEGLPDELKHPRQIRQEQESIQREVEEDRHSIERYN